MKRYDIQATKRYKKDFKRLRKAGFGTGKLERVIELLATGERLPQKYRDHELRGRLKNTRECHIGPDWLLRYAKDEDLLVLILLSTGDHRRVLGME
ncbi:MAG: type II toxin-antitoxin system YafQ family toxin [Candidatus Peribacteraceae bacterium]